MVNLLIELSSLRRKVGYAGISQLTQAAGWSKDSRIVSWALRGLRELSNRPDPFPDEMT